MPRGLLFANMDELAATLRLCDEAAVWKSPCLLYELRDADQQPRWFLSAVGLAVALGQPEAEWVVTNETATELTLASRAEARRYHLVHKGFYPSLFQAIRPQPWRTPPRPDTFVLGTASRERWTEIVRSNLLLGNDRLRLLVLAPPAEEGAAASVEPRSPEATLFLVRVEGLSAFLREKWQAEPEVEIFYPAPTEPRLLLPWGYEYPLVDKFDFTASAEGDLWLVTAEGQWLRTTATWSDLYDHLAVQDLALEVATWLPAEGVEKVDIELRLEPSEAQERPQLWVLAEEERPALEALLREASEEELARLRIAFLAEETGRRRFLLHEVGLGLAPPPLRAGRPFFAPFPDEGLFWPVGQRLTPLLSRAKLTEALRLDRETLTLIEPGSSAHLRVWKVSREALRPIHEIVDYFIAEAVEEVRALERQITFEFEAPLEGAVAGPAVPTPGRRWKGWKGLWGWLRRRWKRRRRGPGDG